MKNWTLNSKYVRVLELLEDEYPESSILYIKNKLKISRQAAGKYLANLRRMGLIELKRNHRFTYSLTGAGESLLLGLSNIEEHFFKTPLIVS